MNEIKELIEQYEMGFISPVDFLRRYVAILQFFGAHKCVEDKVNELLHDFTEDVVKMLKSGNATNNQIEAHGTGAWT